MTKINKLIYMLFLSMFLIPQAQAEWVDISPSVEITQSSKALDRVKRVLFSYVTVKNTSNEALADPVRLVITNPSIPVLNQAGVTESGDAYLQVAEGLAAGASTKVRVDFQLARVKLVFGIRVETEIIQIPDNLISVNLENTGVNVRFDNGNYTLVTPNASKIITSFTQDIDDKTEVNHMVAIINRYDEPVMITLVSGNNTSVALNVENTAEALVLMRPFFFSLEFNDRNELSNRIRSHSEFEVLANEIKKQLESGNTCPLDPDCSYKAALMAERIAIETDLTGLTK